MHTLHFRALRVNTYARHTPRTCLALAAYFIRQSQDSGPRFGACSPREARPGRPGHRRCVVRIAPNVPRGMTLRNLRATRLILLRLAITFYRPPRRKLESLTGGGPAARSGAPDRGGASKADGRPRASSSDLACQLLLYAPGSCPGGSGVLHPRGFPYLENRFTARVPAGSGPDCAGGS